jgi:hypothetical protein
MGERQEADFSNSVCYSISNSYLKHVTHMKIESVVVLSLNCHRLINHNNTLSSAEASGEILIKVRGEDGNFH